MEKKDLKTGMIVELIEGSIGIVMLKSLYGGGDAILYGDGQFNHLTSYNNNMHNTSSHNKYDIIAVYSGPESSWNTADRLSISTKNRKLLWKRNDEKKEEPELKEDIIIIDNKEVSKTTVKAALKYYFDKF